MSIHVTLAIVDLVKAYVLVAVFVAGYLIGLARAWWDFSFVDVLLGFVAAALWPISIPVIAWKNREQ